MDEMKIENNKTANQAWRKKPRRFAPKSRLGCKTCKIRRIKCDLAQPSCLKCQSTGRTCDGYGERPRAESCASSHPCTTVSAYPSKPWYAKQHDLMLQNLGPLMILPVTGSAQAEAMRFFEYISIKHLTEYHPDESWRKTLMFCSQTVPSVRYAAVALAMVHQNYLDRDSSDCVHQLQASKGGLPDQAPLVHYNRAIRLLLNQERGDSTERTAVTLLVCYLFTCFDHLAGNYVQAVKHLRAGVELSRHINRAILNDKNTSDDSEPSGVRTLICQVTRQIHRLDMQAVTFLIDWTPIDLQGTIMSQFPPLDSAFRSLDQAAEHLLILVARIMRLRHTEQQLSPMDTVPPPPSCLKDLVLGQLETWSRLFGSILQQSRPGGTDAETDRLVSLLRLQHTIAGILLRTCGPGREMDYDGFLPQFQQCVAWASDVAAAHERYAGSATPTFTPEIGLVPVLYIIGVKCRHPIVRREVLSILRRQPIREAAWDSISAARVVERVTEIEEGGFGEGQMIRSMAQIAAWQRIETVSWIQSAARLDLTYTFCAREGMHVESLPL